MTWVGTAIMLGSPAMLIAFGFASILVMQRVALEEGRLEEVFGAGSPEWPGTVKVGGGRTATWPWSSSGSDK